MIQQARMEHTQSEDISTRLAMYIDKLDGEYENTHKIRYINTFSRIKDHLTLNGRILELGGKSHIAKFLETEGYAVDEYLNDLRYDFEVPDNTYNFIFLFEVYEHIKDREPDPDDIGSIATFTFSGIHNLLSEIKRVAKNGSLVFMTTPNACSVDALSRIVKNMSPFGFTPHVREYAPYEVRERFTEHGYREVSFSTFFAWNALPGVDRDEYFKALQALGGDPSNRGDDMFFTFEVCK